MDLFPRIDHGRGQRDAGIPPGGSLQAWNALSWGSASYPGLGDRFWSCTWEISIYLEIHKSA